MRLHPLKLADLRRHCLFPAWFSAPSGAAAPLAEHDFYPLSWPHSDTLPLAQEESFYQVTPPHSTPVQLRDTLTAISAMLRLALPAPSWRDYLLPLLFVKCLSDDWLAKRARLTHAYPAQPEAIASGMAKQKISLPLLHLPRLARSQASASRPPLGAQESCLASFETLYSRRNLVEIGVYIDQVLQALEDANPLILRGVFAHLSYSSVRHHGGSVQRHGLWHAILSELGRLQLGAPSAQVSLANVWQELLQPPLAGSSLTQSSLVSQLLLHLWQPNQQASFCDPFCGNGKLLLQLRAAMAQSYAQEAEIAQLATARLTGIVLDVFAAPATAPEHGASLPSTTIQWRLANSLRQPAMQGQHLRQFDLQASNLCGYHLRWERHALREDYFRRFRFGVSPKGKPELLCISHMLACATPGRGKFAVIVQLGCLYRSGNEQVLRHKLGQENVLDAVIILPNLRKGGQHAALLLFDLGRHAHADHDIWLIDANRLDVPDCTPAEQEKIYLKKLLSLYAIRAALTGVATKVSVAQMAAQADSWLPSSYLPTTPTLAVGTADHLEQEIHQLERAVVLAREKLLHALACL